MSLECETKNQYYVSDHKNIRIKIKHTYAYIHVNMH